MPLLQIERQGTRTVIAPGGDLTSSTAPVLRPEVQTLLADGAKELVFDLGATRMVDSQGIGLLIATHNSLSSAGGRLEVVNVSADVLSLLKAMRLDRHFSIAGR
jgi:anti-sigma B factor antagonist